MVNVLGQADDQRSSMGTKRAIQQRNRRRTSWMNQSSQKSLRSDHQSSVSFKATSTILDVILLLMRISLLLNKKRILSALSDLHTFTNGCRNVDRSPLSKYALLACGWCFLFPLAVITCVVIFAVMNSDKYQSSLKLINQNSSNVKLQFILFITGHTILYMNHFLVFPGLVMVLLSFMYVSFAKTFQRHLQVMRFRLIENFSRKEISRAMTVLVVARKIRLDFEKAVSFLCFLAYVLSFGIIMRVVSTIITDNTPNEVSMKLVNSYIILGWTVTWLVLLTMCGAQAKKNESFIKSINQDVAAKNFIEAGGKQIYLVYVNLLNTCLEIDLSFSGWEMFVVDKKMLLTITGVLVTYGVLFATEASKISA
ncbi:uncharacterized protein NPIL_116731 [Nephila pilipes]|uniref:Uncharacterized protein n=1 Tax=Nephila pilipes TaxID=299642 RepID=A0A8X6MKR5_NEPPI|nr:uncharacterized protein NPIL_116731 [Nephila pilipes]